MPQAIVTGWRGPATCAAATAGLVASAAGLVGSAAGLVGSAAGLAGSAAGLVGSAAGLVASTAAGLVGSAAGLAGAAVGAAGAAHAANRAAPPEATPTSRSRRRETRTGWTAERVDGVTGPLLLFSLAFAHAGTETDGGGRQLDRVPNSE